MRVETDEIVTFLSPRERVRERVIPSPVVVTRFARTTTPSPKGGVVKGWVKKLAAFTLAEVLITLGIIGVVAALAMPSLIQHYKKQEASARLKKFYSMMNQAIMLSTVDNGEVSDWQRNVDHGLSDENRQQNLEYGYAFFMKYLEPYIKYASIEQDILSKQKGIGGYEMIVNFSDSSIVYVHNGGCVDFKFDVNGNNKPNALGRDIYVFTMCLSKSNRRNFQGNVNTIFGPYINKDTPTREIARQKCAENVYYCSNLLLYDGWEFKSDYPHKL